MADFIFNVAKGRVHQFAKNVKDGAPANSRLLAIPIQTAGIEADATLKDHDTLSALLAASNDEQTTMGRKTIPASDITITVDDTNEWVDVDLADISWLAATGNAISAIVICYIPDGVAPGADTTVVPLSKHDFVVTPDGSEIKAVIAAAGFYRAP